MASSHVHHVCQDDGRYHHLFNLLFMTVAEMEVLALALASKPITMDKISILDNLKEHMRRMHNTMISKDSEQNIIENNLVKINEGQVKTGEPRCSPE